MTIQAAAEVALELAKVAAKAADDKKADRTLILQVGEVLEITDYFVITSASNRRLVKTVVDAIEEAAREQLGRKPLRSEGVSEQQWVLVDYGDVVVHVFAEEMRMYYEIERLYRDVPRSLCDLVNIRYLGGKWHSLRPFETAPLPRVADPVTVTVARTVALAEASSWAGR
jgi:ribosome-associated protein